MSTTSRNGTEAIVRNAGGFPQWSHEYAAAWIGLLATHRRLTRELDAELEAEHGLTLSGLELLARLASVDERRLRLSTLAGEAGLSLSRVSRIVDLGSRRLVDLILPGGDAVSAEVRAPYNGLSAVRDGDTVHFALVHQRSFQPSVSERS